MTSGRGSFRSRAWTASAGARPGSAPTGDLPPGYFAELGRISLLSAEEEVRLAQTVEQGRAAAQRLADQAGRLPEQEAEDLAAQIDAGSLARARLAEANLRLVVRVANRYLHRGVGLDDLVQEGSLGLLRAVDKFDWRQGFRFSTYATWWIHQAIARAVENGGRPIRIPVPVLRLANQVGRTAGQLEQAYGREPTATEIGAALHLPAEQVQRLLRLVPQTVSLDEQVGDNEVCALAEVLPDSDLAGPEEVVEHQALEEGVRGVLHTLTSRERYVIRRRFGFEAGQEETFTKIGKELGVSRERVRQLEVNALTKLREPTRATQLDPHVVQRATFERPRQALGRGEAAQDEKGLHRRPTPRPPKFREHM